MKVTILGIKRAKTKSGRDFCQYYYSKNFTDYEMENSDCEGLIVGSEFSYRDYNIRPGDECDFQYEPGFEGKATLSDVVVLKPVDGIPFEKEKTNENAKQ